MNSITSQTFKTNLTTPPENPYNTKPVYKFLYLTLKLISLTLALVT